MRGVVRSPPDVRDSYTNLRLEADTLQSVQDGQSLPVEGMVLAKVPLGEEWHYGDRLRLTGKLETPPAEEEFSYREYLARQGVYSLIQPTEISLLSTNQGNPAWAALYALKQYALDTVYRIFPDPEASLMAGILLGVEVRYPCGRSRSLQSYGDIARYCDFGF